MDRDRTREGTAEQDFLRWRQHGDAAALGRVFDQLAPEVLLVAGHLAGRGSAEDLLQATFVAAITDAARWDRERPLLPWLVGILANLARRERERASRLLDATRVPSADAPDPREEAEREEGAVLLADALRGMPRQYRQVLTLRFVHGLEPAAIAHALGSPPATVKSRLQRGMVMLQRALPSGLRLAALAPLPMRSLDVVREAVLAHAALHTAVAGSVAGAVLATGVVLLMKKTLVLVTSLALVGVVAFSLPSMFGSTSSAPQSSAAGAPVALESAVVADQRAHALPSSATEVVDRREVVAAPPQVPAVAPAVHGRVVDERGEALADVLVLLGDRAYSPFQDRLDFLGHVGNGHVEELAADVRAQLVRTAADGTFGLAKPPNDRPHLLVVWSASRACRAMELPAELGPPIEIVLPHDPVVTGVVRRRIGAAPIVFAQVNVWPANNGTPVDFKTSDGEGRYTLQPLPPGDYRVQVEAEGFVPGRAKFTLSAATPDHALELALDPLPTISVLLVDGNGQPWTWRRVAKAIGGEGSQLDALLSQLPCARRSEAQLFMWRNHWLRFDGNGRVRGFDEDDQARVLSVWCDDEKLFEVPDFDPTASQVHVELLPRATIDLQVRITLEPADASLPDVHIAVTDVDQNLNLIPVVDCTTKQPLSVLTVPANFAGRECGLLVECAGRAPYFTKVSVPERAAGIWRDVVLLPGDQVLRGTIVGPDGQPVLQGSVQLVDSEGHWLLPPGVTGKNADPHGAFVFEGLPRRRARLFVRARECAPAAFDVEIGDPTPLRLELHAARAVKVELPAGVIACAYVVRDAEGRTLADDRLSGNVRYGGGPVQVDAQAATLEAYDGVRGALVGSGPVPADGTLVLQPPTAQGR